MCLIPLLFCLNHQSFPKISKPRNVSPRNLSPICKRCLAWLEKVRENHASKFAYLAARMTQICRPQKNGTRVSGYSNVQDYRSLVQRDIKDKQTNCEEKRNVEGSSPMHDLSMTIRILNTVVYHSNTRHWPNRVKNWIDFTKLVDFW